MDVPKDQGKEGVYQRLGTRTFLVFTLQKLSFTGFLFLCVLLVFFLRSLDFFSSFASFLNPLVMIGFLFTLLSLLITLGISWMQYLYYEYCLGPDSLKIRRGVFDQEEISIPYRQIQNVNIFRNMTDRSLGVSQLVIMTAGRAEGKGEETEGVLPAIEDHLAEEIQTELLRRANN